jgi:hypothetical protein
MKSLLEGLKKHDLKDLVLPLITIDEYNSKIDNDKMIVVGFYVFEQDAAYDLSNFIERSPYAVIDTDVSPAPTKDGYYVTFVEMSRTPSFPQQLQNILDEITHLSDIDDWQFTSPLLDKDQIQSVSEQSLQKYVDTKIRQKQNRKVKECYDFFVDSLVSDLVTEDGKQFAINQNGQVFEFEVVKIGTQIPVGKLDLSESAIGSCLMIQKILMGPYAVHSQAGNIVIENVNTGTYCTIKNFTRKH